MEENKKIFADSNCFIGMFNVNDGLHECAKKIAGEIQDAVLFISNFVFLETVTVLSQRCGKKTAQEAGAHLLENPLIEIIHIDETLQKETWRIFQEMESKNIGFVDCSILAVMQEEKISDLLTFDTADFKKLAKQHGISLFSVK